VKEEGVEQFEPEANENVNFQQSESGEDQETVPIT
jgi:hypothetical protein